MEKEEIEELAMAVAMVEYYQEIIDSKKDKIRNLSEEEIAKIAEKYPPEKETTKNYTIKLQATSYTNSKREIITNKLATQNKTQLRRVASKIKRG